MPFDVIARVQGRVRAARARIGCGLMVLASPLLMAAVGTTGDTPIQTDAQSRRVVASVETLLLDVTINTLPLNGIIRVYKMGDGHLVLPIETWNEARLKPAGPKLTLPDGHEGYSLDAVDGLHYRLNGAALTLVITAPAAAFDDSVVDTSRGGSGPPNRASPGVYLNYDVTGTHAEGNINSYGGLIEGVAFNSWGSAVTGLAVRDFEGAAQTIRTDSYLERDDPGSLDVLVVGDTISSDGGWSRPVRYGGVRWARDFLLRPGYITFPIPSLSGSAALPSTVDVLVNNQRQVSGQPVAPGPFTLNNIPLVTGAGDVNLVVKDVRGVETVFTQSFYTAPRLLEAGLSDFSLESGKLRYDYGTESNDYGAGFGAATYRYGLNRALTAETRVEVQRDRTAAGVEFDGLIGTYASYRAAAGGSAAGGERGGHYLIGFDRITPLGAASIQWDHYDSAYLPFAFLPRDSRVHEQVTAAFGMKLARHVSAAANFTSQTSWNTAPYRSASVNLNVSVAWGLNISAYVMKQLNVTTGGWGGWSGAVNLLLSLGHLRTVTAGSQRDAAGKFTDYVEADQSISQGPSVGWRVRASDDPTQQLQGGVTLNTNVGTFEADVNEGRGYDAVRLSASGSVGLLEGLPFATREIGEGSFGIVQVGDLPGIRVYRSSQLVATTNGAGLALVPSLLPYQANQITIDPDQLPLDVEIHEVKALPIPYARSGMLVKFDLARSRNALVILTQRDGSFIPSGAHASLSAGGDDFDVGLRGELYLMGVQDHNVVTIRWQDRSCVVSLNVPPPDADGNAPRIRLTCDATP